MKSKTAILLALAAIGVVVIAAIGRHEARAWKRSHDLDTTHIVYSHFACAAANCPAYQVDVWGSGRVIYQGFGDVAVAGAYTYHIPKKDLQAWLADFRISGFWQQPRPEAPGPEGGGCRITLLNGRHALRNGCLDLVGDDNMTLETPRLSADVAQLEALLKLRALVEGKAVAGVTPYTVSDLKPYHSHRF